MNLELILGTVDGAFKWDGWRALAALGTFAAVVVALNRDRVSERQRMVREAHMIGAMIAELEPILDQIKNYNRVRGDREALQKAMRSADRLNNIDPAIDLFKSLKLSDCPSVEVMTTVSVVRSSVEHIRRVFAAAKNALASKTETFPALEDLDLDIVTLTQCIRDFEAEQALAAGPYRQMGTQTGHRSEARKKLYGSPRAQSLKSLPSLLRTIITNRPRT